MTLDNCIYRFLDKNNEVIYIGKARKLIQRINNHSHLPKSCYEEKCAVEFTSFDTEDEMDIAERYFVPKYKPKYNTMMGNRNIGMSLMEFDNKEWITLEKYYEIENIKKLKEIELKKIKKANEKALNLAIIKAEILCDMKIDRDKVIKLEDVDEIINNYNKIQEEIEVCKHQELIRVKEENEAKELQKYLNKKVMCISTGEIFDNILEFKIKFYEGTNISFTDLIYGAKGNFGSCYTYHPEYYGVYVSPLFTDVFEGYDNERKLYHRVYQSENIRKVICLTNGEIYVNKYEAQDKNNIHYSRIVKCCNDEATYSGTLGDKPLVWKWYDEYLDMSSERIQSYLHKAKNIYELKNKTKVAQCI